MNNTPPTIPDNLSAKLQKLLESRGIRRPPKVYSDTYQSMSIDYGDIILLGNTYYLITGFEKEGRFGINEQLKYWVKKAIDIETGVRFIIKCVFYETFLISIGPFKVNCFRNPDKEAKVLDLVRGREHFMQGYGIRDDGGNLLRVLDIIQGKRLDTYISSRAENHRDYFKQHVPDILTRYLKCVEGIMYLHANGLKHGDIRRDHILIDSKTGAFKWIDFDYDFYIPERPYSLDIYGLGNILLYIAGGRNYRGHDVLEHPDMGQKTFESLAKDDLALLFQDRIFNIKKLFPYIPDQLNNILLHFSYGTRVFYDTVEEFHKDLSAYVETLPDPQKNLPHPSFSYL